MNFFKNEVFNCQNLDLTLEVWRNLANTVSRKIFEVGQKLVKFHTVFHEFTITIFSTERLEIFCQIGALVELLINEFSENQKIEYFALFCGKVY